MAPNELSTTRQTGDDQSSIERPFKVRRVSMENMKNHDNNNEEKHEYIQASSARNQKRRVTLDQEGIVGPTLKRHKYDNFSSKARDDNAALEQGPVVNDQDENTAKVTPDIHVEKSPQTNPSYEMSSIITPHPSSLELADTPIQSETSSDAEEKSHAESEISTCRISTKQPLPKEQKPESKASVPETKRSGVQVFLLQFIVQIFVFMAFIITKQMRSQIQFPDNNCIYVTGGGFSGFWFSLGRLRSISDPSERNFVCYSAGCLGSVAALGNSSMEELYDIASTAREQWLNGERHRHDIVEFFVDGLLKGTDTAALNQSLDRLYILTSTTDPNTAVPVGHMQTPTSLKHLKTLLMQTTWIPYATGSHYSHHGHLDGAFSVLQHPKCNDKIGLAWDFELLANALNPNIGADMVAKFWNMGLEYGL